MTPEGIEPPTFRSGVERAAIAPRSHLVDKILVSALIKQLADSNTVEALTAGTEPASAAWPGRAARMIT